MYKFPFCEEFSRGIPYYSTIFTDPGWVIPYYVIIIYLSSKCLIILLNPKIAYYKVMVIVVLKLLAYLTKYLCSIWTS
jgi:hypothetical protein